MSYGLSYDIPGILPGIILLISLMLTLLKHAAILCQKRLQQKNVAVSEKSSCSPHPCAGSEGENSIFRSDRRTHEKRLTKTEHCGRTGGDSSNCNQGTNSEDFKKDRKGVFNNCQQSRPKVPQKANPTDNNVEISVGLSHHRIAKSQRPTGYFSPGVPCCSKTRENPKGPQPRTDRKTEQATRGPLWNQGDSAHLQSDGIWSVKRLQATQVYLKTKTVSTCSNYITDELDTEQFIYTVLQQVVQQTQKHMYEHLQQSMQQTLTAPLPGGIVSSW